MTQKVFIVSYFFPPVGGAGVQRVAKFVKYLPEAGWEPVVLTTSNPSVPLFDETLVAEIPAGTVIHRARTLEPDYGAKQAVSAASDQSVARNGLKVFLKRMLRTLANFLLQPDPQVLWLPAAYREACRAIRGHRPDVIFSSAPPFSSLLLGAMLARKFQLPLVLDYRDEWDISNSVWENKRMGRFSLALQQRMQKYAVTSASAIIATTELSADALRAKLHKWGGKATVSCIYNGYDAADFTAPVPRAESDKLVLAYVGTLWNLTSIEPLVRAIRILSREYPELAGSLKIELAGRRTAEQNQLLTGLQDTPVQLVIHDYLSHPAALQLMRQADTLVLLLSNLDMARRVVPGKIFEYLATGNNILAITPQGEVWKLLRDYQRAQCCEPADAAAIAELLAEQLRDFRSRGHLCHEAQDALRYERRELTGQLAALLSQVVNPGSGK